MHSIKPTGKYFFLFCLIFFANRVIADTVISVTDSGKTQNIGNFVQIFLDSTGKMSSAEILARARFTDYNKAIPFFPVNKNAIWIRFTVFNNTASPNASLLIPFANISNVELYTDSANALVRLTKTGNAMPVSNQTFRNPAYILKLPVKPGDAQTYYLRIASAHPVLLPMHIAKPSDVQTTLSTQFIIISLYLGIIISIFFYNFFLFISTFDKSYFYYILYIALLALAQLTLAGYSYPYLWKDLPEFNRFAVPITTCLAGIGASLFAISFLRTKLYRIIHIVFIFLIVLYVSSALSSILGYNSLSYGIIDRTNIIAAVFSLGASFYIGKKGYRPAYFYFISWAAFSVAIIIFSLRNFDILPDNAFTTYALYIGSAIETILLSFALADKINLLQKEKQASQALALKISQENEKLIREQNVILEQKVAERTDELQSTNKQLSKTLSDLKEAQIQLVEAEKMASLGQLTAGIAHEINNPINFVKSNIKPLKLDINDLLGIISDYNSLHTVDKEKMPQQLAEVYEKQQELDLEYVKSEIQHLVKGIEDGAERTAEIVRGLRTFSRLDESELKVANVHDGLESTLVLLRNSIPTHITIEKKFFANGNIECFAGKLNQVFMNILNNAVQAINAKKPLNGQEFITITTSDTPDGHIRISIKDTGIGMAEQIKNRIYEPFFTTKDVGEGTGLGMAIVFKIIQEHFGKIEVISEPGKGAEFIITLPHAYPGS